MAEFTTSIQEWYRLNARLLPWRSTKNPYKIWLSEVILQQTRVEQGLKYYEKFISTYPTVADLADAPEDDVLKLWQGLGYYSRARNLHSAAKTIFQEYQGEFPNTYQQIRQLKGIGDYTAAAISSFAFDLPHAVVDGNVYRVLSRYFALSTPIDSTQGKKEFQLLANELLDEQHPANHNQAIMEIGALVCTPRNPQCENCPVQGSCQAFADKDVLAYPTKAKKTKVVPRYMNYLVALFNEQIIIRRRNEKDIWQGLYEFPLIEKKDETLLTKGDLNEFDFKDFTHMKTYTHLLSHQRITAHFYQLELKSFQPESNDQLIPLQALEQYALPQLLIRYLNEHPVIES
jgi:A/G-specific adenine glycosylase